MPQMRDPQSGQQVQLPYPDQGGGPGMGQMGGGLEGLSEEQLMMLLQMLMQQEQGPTGGAGGGMPPGGGGPPGF